MKPQKPTWRRPVAAPGYSLWPFFGGYAGSCHTTSARSSYSEATLRFYTQQHRFYIPASSSDASEMRTIHEPIPDLQAIFIGSGFTVLEGLDLHLRAAP